jgi:hypothetical protein
VVRHRFVRDEVRLADEAVLVRALFSTCLDGALFDRGALVADATRNFELFGYYGLSLWLGGVPWPVERVLGEKCRKAARAELFTAGDLRD